MEKQEVVPGLTLELACEGRIAIFSVVDRVGLGHVSRAVDLGLRLLQGGPYRVVLDFSQARAVRSVAVGFIAYFGKIARKKGGGLVLVAPSEEVERELAPQDLRKLFKVYDTREEAFSALLAAASPRMGEAS